MRGNHRRRPESVRNLWRLGLTLATFSALLSTGRGADVWTFHNDNLRTGQNLGETELTPAKVKAGFGKLFSHTVDGVVYAQPLVLQGVNVAGKGKHDVVYVATEHDSVFAFDASSADGPNAKPLWQVGFLNPGAGVTTVPANGQPHGENDVGTTDLMPEIGITGTPVIDVPGGTLYVVAKTKERIGGHTHFVQRLHALDVGSGAEKHGGPVVIADTISDPGQPPQFVSGPLVAGAGESNDGQGHVVFNALRQHQRPALALNNGVVYVSWAAHGDQPPFHGWLVGYDAQTLKAVAMFNTTPNAVSPDSNHLAAGGLWMSGAPPAIDAQGTLYFATGNGIFDTAFDAGGFPNRGDYGNSVLKVTPDPTSTPTHPNINGWGLKIADYFTPHNQAVLEVIDGDLGSGGVLLLPDQPAPRPHLLVAAGKEGTIYLLDRDQMGKFHQGNDDQIVQSLPKAVGGAHMPRLYSSPAFFNNRVYYQGVDDVLKAFEIQNGKLSAAPVMTGKPRNPFRGGTPSISANGNAAGIVWTISSTDPLQSPAILRAYDANDLSTELYNSDTAGTHDQPGGAVKFSVPTIANGKVYVGTQFGLAVFGLLP